jgi:hypothetical protein
MWDDVVRVVWGGFSLLGRGAPSHRETRLRRACVAEAGVVVMFGLEAE